MTVRTALVLATLLSLAGPTSALAQRRIDPERSTLDVFVYKSGLFSVLADNHVIRAPIDEGRVSDEGSLSVELTVKSAGLIVMDPKLSADKRADVAERMHGPEVLDTRQHPTIRFVSRRITAEGPDQWRVDGELALHGVSRPVSGLVTSRDGHYRGSMTIRQRDFGIKPISIAGGAVKVKDEVRIEFDIVTTSR